jgi:hypothetical protein
VELDDCWSWAFFVRGTRMRKASSEMLLLSDIDHLIDGYESLVVI